MLVNPRPFRVEVAEAVIDDLLDRLARTRWPAPIPGSGWSYGTDAFDLVVASLPGFGFIGKPRVPGWGVTRIAAAFDELMGRLGYLRYGAQGGDRGGIISAQLGADRPERCVAIHVNMTYATMPDPVPDDLRAWAEGNLPRWPPPCTTGGSSPPSSRSAARARQNGASWTGPNGLWTPRM